MTKQQFDYWCDKNHLFFAQGENISEVGIPCYPCYIGRADIKGVEFFMLIQGGLEQGEQIPYESMVSYLLALALYRNYRLDKFAEALGLDSDSPRVAQHKAWGKQFFKLMGRHRIGELRKMMWREPTKEELAQEAEGV